MRRTRTAMACGLGICILLLLVVSQADASSYHRVYYIGNGNRGGTVPVDRHLYVQNEMVTVSLNSGDLTRGNGDDFAGWNTSPDDRGFGHQPGDRFAMPGYDVYFYAIYNHGYSVWFQANTTELYNNKLGNWHLGMAARTSPVTGYGSVWFQANTGYLWNTKTGDQHLGMAPDTSPSYAFDGSVWFQANTGALYNTSIGNTHLGMAPGTSPFVSNFYDPYSGYYITVWFQANTGHLWGGKWPRLGDTGLLMAPGTSPAVGSDGSLWFQGANGNLWEWKYDGTTRDWGLGMAPGTSPAPNGSEELCWFQANTHHLWSTLWWDTGLVMDSDTSPAAADNGTVWFQGSNGSLWNTFNGDQHLGMALRTNPDIAY